MQRYYFTLDIPASEYLRYYSGAAARVLVKAHDGRTLSLPAVNLRRFVTNAGIRGAFCLTVDDAQRFVSLERQDRATPGVRA
ncbi:DUF2835 domain-containing protein [Marichromatium gracile]|uniref:DUF2835 domain-containing protein n=1 Tax=Marichromatium gracile TaxID=1048 RepID=UPI001F3DD451|nr:DUF2835 domain-containing protein [Marichromatium gracile]MCF1184368.1 DUF2835 domain-containing protein [Marichromatium gracile]